MTVDLAFDLGTAATGAVWDGPDGVPRSTTIRCGGGVAAPGGGYDNGPSFHKFHIEARGLLVLVKPRRVAVLSPLKRGGKGQTGMAASAQHVELSLGLYAIIQMLCTEMSIACFKIADNTARMHFCGNGQAPKEANMARCNQLRWPMKNQDEADAASAFYALKAIADPKWRPAQGFVLFQEGVKRK